jgi:membrane-bound lytic murein transglycosylase A
VLPRLETGLVLACLIGLAGCQPDVPDTPEPVEDPVNLPITLDFLPTSWSEMSGWAGADLAPGLSAFLRSCDRMDRRAPSDVLSAQASWAGRVSDWQEVCQQASRAAAGEISAQAAFETALTPVIARAVDPDSGTTEMTGRLTGYYEPYVEVRESRQGTFTQPLRRRPDDLVTVDLGLFDEALAGRRLVGEVRDGQLVHYKDRAAIEAEDAGEIFAWGEPIEVFFLQIQGSGRLVYPDGRQERAAFAAHNGLPYRSIGRELIERGELEAHAASKAGIEAWLMLNGPEATAELFSVNPRYVFFQTQPLTDPDLGPSGSTGIALTPMASIAVDPAHQAYGVPVWLSTDLPEIGPWSGLVVTQDTGGAIRGPLRGDFFWGWGETAERRAGTTRTDAEWVLLLPHTVVARLFAEQSPV